MTVLDGGARVHPATLLWEGDEYRVIEDREWHTEACQWGNAPCKAGERPHGPHVITVERCVRTDPFGIRQWAACDGLPAAAIRAMLRALTVRVVQP